MKGIWTLLAAAMLTTLPSIGPVAADYKVWMKGSGTQSMDFEPAFLKVAPGDKVVFMPDAAGHNVESIEGIAPQGTAPWVGDLDKEHAVTFTAEGLHGYKCPPHLEIGKGGTHSGRRSGFWSRPGRGRCGAAGESQVLHEGAAREGGSRNTGIPAIATNSMPIARANQFLASAASHVSLG